MTIEENCSCGKVMLKTECVGLNWKEDCLIHGINSLWYKNEGEKSLDEQRKQSVEFQLKAREFRKKFLKNRKDKNMEKNIYDAAVFGDIILEGITPKGFYKIIAYNNLYHVLIYNTDHDKETPNVEYALRCHRRDSACDFIYLKIKEMEQ